MSESAGNTVEVRLEWGDDGALVAVAVNRFHLGFDPVTGGIAVTFGYVALPMMMGTPDDQAKAISAMEFVTVRPLGRFVLPQKIAAELAAALRAELETETVEQSTTQPVQTEE